MVGDVMTHFDDKAAEIDPLLETHVQARLGSRVRSLRVVVQKENIHTGTFPSDSPFSRKTAARIREIVDAAGVPLSWGRFRL
jgi:hypothetical protein